MERLDDLSSNLKDIMADNVDFKERLIKLEEKVNQVEEDNQSLKEECQKLTIENNRLKSDIVTNQKLSNAAEQNNRKYNLVFRNIDVGINEEPEACWEKVKDVVHLVQTDNSINYSDIAACHPMPAKKGKPSIIVKFLNLHVAEQVYQQRKKTIQMGNVMRTRLGVPSGKNVTIHPNLSVLNQKLLTQAFELKEQCNWKYIWADPKGNIKARKGDTSTIVPITCTDDIYEADENIQTTTTNNTKIGLETLIFC